MPLGWLALFLGELLLALLDVDVTDLSEAQVFAAAVDLALIALLFLCKLAISSPLVTACLVFSKAGYGGGLYRRGGERIQVSRLYAMIFS